MKSFKYAALTALLLSSMTAGCNSSWNPFYKKPADPPLATGMTTMDDPAVGRPTAFGTTDPATSTGAVTGMPLDAGTETAGDVVIADPTPPAGADTYTIKKKDTLWSISTRYLGSGKRYKEIVAINPGLDPKKLAIGQVIKLPPK